MRFTMTIRAYKNTFLGFPSGFVDACLTDVELFLGGVFMMEMEIPEISIVSADAALPSVFGNQKLLYVLSLYPRFFCNQLAVLPIVFSLITRGAQLAVIATPEFGRAVSVKISERFRHLTRFTFPFVHIVNT